MSLADKPGYLAYLPGAYQSLGPEQDQSLDRILAIAGEVATDEGPVVEFWVKTPNVRCRTRVSVVLEPDSRAVNTQQDENTEVIGDVGHLWVAEKERSRSGVIRSSPVRNVVATAAAPLAIPTDLRLWGYSFELETNGEELYGQFTPPGGQSCKWRLIARYESVERLSREEWNQFLQQYGIRVAPPEGVAQEPQT